MKNKKGYTMEELLVAFVIIAFILGIGVVSYRFIIDRIEANYYDTLEEELLLAGSDYFTNHREERPLSGYSAIQIDELVGDEYIETLKDRKGNVCSKNNDSKVYIYKTSDGYDYEACLVCNEYKTSGTYCDGLAMGVINISAVKEDGSSYNPLLSYENTSWSNSDVTVTFSVSTDVTKFIITNTNNGEKKVCDSIVNRSCSMKFPNTSTYNVEAYNESVSVAPTKGFNIKIDKEAPAITYNLDAGTYEENKDVTVTVTDNRKISSVEYKLYKDDVLSSSGNPTITSQTSVSFDVKLDDYVTWKLEVTATDNAGNETSDTRSFVIRKSQICEWVNVETYTPTSCTPTEMSTTPVVGDRYTECDGPKNGNWRYYCPRITCSDGTTISSTISSDYIYSSQAVAKNMISSAWGVAHSRCEDYEGVNSSNWHGYCTTQQLKYYSKKIYEYQCTEITPPVITYSLESGTYNEAKTVTVTVTDDKKIASVEYKLYKDDELVSSGNPTIETETSVSFDNNLNSAGTWKLDVVATDDDVNETKSSRNFVINTSTSCKWVEIDSSTPTSCTSVTKPSNPSKGETYDECDGPYYGNWRYYCSQTSCYDGFIIPSGPYSDYIYTSRTDAEMACADEWGNSGHSACVNRGGAGSSWSNDCQILQLVYYQKHTYEYQCD